MDIPVYNPTKLAGMAGRMKLDKYIERDYPEFYVLLISRPEYEGLDFKERLYWYFNGIKDHPVCKTCGKPTKFHGPNVGYAEHCCARCTQLDKTVRERNTNTNIERYGKNFREVIHQRVCKTKEERYGDRNFNNHKKFVETMVANTGTDNPMKVDSIRSKARKTCLERYGSEYYFTSDEGKSRMEEFSRKRAETNTRLYGFEYATQNESVKEKLSRSVMEKYGVPWSCLRDEAHHSRLESVNSMVFSKLLDDRGIEYEKEIRLEDRSYDFRIGDTLVEINPSATHNINFNPFDKDRRKLLIDKKYHKRKSELAIRNGYRCIHVWDWDDYSLIADMFCGKEKIHARDCEIKIVESEDTDKFLNNNHIQKTCKGQEIRIGLYLSGELVEIMTFGKPRYNKRYQWELLRLCTTRKKLVVGGAERLFKYFIDNWNPESIVSYCDLSKFTGSVYERLGMERSGGKDPSLHWSDMNGKKHYTDSLLRQLGADKLIGTSLGKGTSNSEIMLQNKFVQIYDCGQARYVYKRNTDETDNSTNRSN